MRERFDADTALEPLADGVFAGRIDRGWWIFRGPNGGYVSALLLRAAQLRVGPDRAPRSLSIHFLAPPAEGPVRVEAQVERAGRSLTTLSLRLLQDGRPLALGLAALSRARPGPTLDLAPMPDVPPPEACARLVATPDDIPMRHRYEYRPAFGDVGKPSPEGVTGGWIRLPPPRLVDALAVAAFADAWPPSVYASMPERAGGRGVPTVDIAIHFRATLPRVGEADDAFTLALFRTRVLRDGFLEEDGELWAPDGTLLAQSRQLAVLA